MRQAVPSTWRATAEKQRTHGGSLSYADGGDGRPNVSHGIVDGKARGDAAARRVDVQIDWLRGILSFEEKELSDDGSGDGFIDGAIEADDALFQKAGEDVVLYCESLMLASP